MGLGRAALTLSKLAHEEWDLPKTPTWIVLGRSNVGKSSLLNALIHPQKIFRSGATPGLTRGLLGAEVSIGRAKLFLLDLPGWGYSVKNSIEAQTWSDLGEKLEEKMWANLSQLIWLVDPRRKLEASEQEVLRWLGPKDWALVFTKADQVKRSERRSVEKEWESAVTGSSEHPLWVSAKSGEGMPDLLKRARSFIRLRSEWMEEDESK